MAIFQLFEVIQYTWINMTQMILIEWKEIADLC